MSFPSKQYAPPGVYTSTSFENPLSSTLEALKIPVLIGEGNEELLQSDLEIVRGSSAVADQRVVDEDVTGRAVLSVTPTGIVTLTDFDGTLDRFQVRHFPIVNGDGTGTTTNNRTDVTVTVNGSPVVVRSVVGALGIVQLAQPINPTDEVRVTYYFDRTDTLLTDDVSSQVPATLAVVHAVTGTAAGVTFALHGDVIVNGAVTVPANNILKVRVDGTLRTLVIPPRVNYTTAEVALAINALGAGTLAASTFTNHLGHTALVLTAESSLEVLDSVACAPLGLVPGSADNRVSTFHVFQRPIVDGSGGGITTTDPAHVTVKVDGKQVIPTAVDGASGAVTLPFAPRAGARVVISYYWNTWQDTFDYLAHIGVDRVVRCGSVRGSSDYVQDADFILQDSKIVWGTAATAERGIASGSTAFGESQVSLTLVDNRNFLGECAPVVRSSGGVAKESRTEFTLPLQPTLGNGRDTPLGQSLFQTISNGRLDLPVNRPDVIWAYWGWSAQDAFLRGRVEVTKVDGLVITLAEPVPPGAKVYATSYYNQIEDGTYTLSVKTAGASGVGTYEVTNSSGDMVYGARLAGKGTALTGVTVEFPGGSELSPDFRFESGSGTIFKGPVDEVVTVTFASRPAGPARFVFPGAAPYYPVAGASDRLRLVPHGVDDQDGINLSLPGTDSNWALSHLVGEEISYTGGNGATAGQTFTTDTAEEFALRVDGADILVVVPPLANQDVTAIADAINEAAGGHQGRTQAGSTAGSIVLAATASSVDDYYVGYKVVIGHSDEGGMIGGGQTRTVTAYDAATKTATLDAEWAGGDAPPAQQPYYIYNPEARSALVGVTKFDGPVTVRAGHFDSLRVVYQGKETGAAGAIEATISAGTYSSAALLAAEVNAQLAAAITELTDASPEFLGLRVECSANVDGQLAFRLQLPGVDSSGYLRFLDAATAGEDFATLAGISHAGSITGTQGALLQGPIARAYECPASAGVQKPYDRLIIRSRVLAAASEAKTLGSTSRVEVLTPYERGGLVAGAYATANAATVAPASVTARVSLQHGQDATTCWPGVTFYDGTGTKPANNVLNLVISGVPVTVTFEASASGLFTPVGPVGTSGSVAYQIKAAITSALTGAGWEPSHYDVRVVGSTLLEITVSRDVSADRLTVNAGTANAVLGFTTGTRYAVPTTAEDIASAIMSDATGSLASWLLNPATTSAGYFAHKGIAGVQSDGTGAKHLYVQDAPTLVSDLGSASSILVKDAPVQNALSYGTGLNAADGDGDVGDEALEGFFVTSSHPHGSGSANTSVLNDGEGQDGIVGQTYRDAVTGLTFTVLPRGFSANPTGPWVAYPTGGNANFRINVSSTFVCDANIPTLAVPGVEMRVANTTGLGVEDTAIVKTFKRSGNEPAIGDLYYASYVYRKQDYTTGFYTKASAVETAFGASIPDNPVSLAANLAMLNGAVLIGIKQVNREEGSNQASLTAYRNAIEELEGVLPGGASPDIVVPLRGDSLDLFQFLKKSNDKMSSERYKSERTSIIGVAAGTFPKDVGNWAQALRNTRMRLVYPDMLTITVQDALMNTKEYLIDGVYAAAMLAGSVVSPNADVATPWTGRRLVGATQLARRLDAVEQNQLAVKGVTILEDRAPFLRVRHGLTTDMTNILTKLPTVIQIDDEVHRQTRNVLDGFSGIKFLPGVTSQIEGRLSTMFKNLVQAQIVMDYRGVKATPNLDDPTSTDVEAHYSPVFPLLYVHVRFHLRSSANT